MDVIVKDLGVMIKNGVLSTYMYDKPKKENIFISSVMKLCNINVDVL